MSAGDVAGVELSPEFQSALEELNRLFAAALHHAMFNSCHSAWVEIERTRIANKKVGIINDKFEQWRDGSAGVIRAWLPRFVDLASAYPEAVGDPIRWSEDSVWKVVEGGYEIQRPQEDEPLPIAWSVNRVMVYWFAVASEFAPQVNVSPLRPWSAPRWLARSHRETNALLEKHVSYLWLRINREIKDAIGLAKIRRSIERGSVKSKMSRMPPFRWEDIDLNLVNLKLTNLSLEMGSWMREEEARIHFEDRGNLNSGRAPSLVLDMKLKCADEWARRMYEIYSDVWQIQGGTKSAAFVRSVCAQAIVPFFQTRTGAIANQFSSFAASANFPSTVRDATLTTLQMNMQRLEDSWRRHLEVEARECEHVEQRMQAEQEPQLGRVANKKTAARVTNQAARQTPEDEGGQVRSLRDRRTNGRKPGRRPRRNRSFVICAGTQWRRASSDNRTRVTHDQLRNIAVALDAAGYTPPGKYLEGRSAKELKEFNSRNSNSKAGPIKTWVQLISINDKDHVRGMRRLLYRCAKVDGRPMSGN